MIVEPTTDTLPLLAIPVDSRYFTTSSSYLSRVSGTFYEIVAIIHSSDGFSPKGKIIMYARVAGFVRYPYTHLACTIFPGGSVESHP